MSLRFLLPSGINKNPPLASRKVSTCRMTSIWQDETKTSGDWWTWLGLVIGDLRSHDHLPVLQSPCTAFLSASGISKSVSLQASRKCVTRHIKTDLLMRRAETSIRGLVDIRSSCDWGISDSLDWWISDHMTTQLLAASLRSCAFASLSPLKRLRRMNDRCRPKLLAPSPAEALAAAGAAPVPDVPAEDSAATSITSLTLRWDVLAEVSE